jgi:hypothetical protein
MTVFRLIASKHRSASWKGDGFHLLLTWGFSLTAFLSCCIESNASQAGKSHFFATREACAASGEFRKWECETAFANAAEQLYNQAPSFPSKADCQLQFRLCGRRPSESDSDADYAPLALGIEIANTPEGSIAAPALAVETPAGMLPPRPVSRAFGGRRMDKSEPRNVELAPRTDRFEPFFGGRVIEQRTFIRQSSFMTLAPEKTNNAPTLETLQDRRLRIKNAPFIE